MTVIEGLPDNAEFVGELSQSLKRACGTGGTGTGGVIELQGDRRERLRELLAKRGIAVKG